MDVVVQRHTSAALPPGKRPVGRLIGGSVTPGPVLTRAENLALTWILSLDRSAHGELLYRLSYRPTVFHRVLHIAPPTSTQLITEDRM